MEKRKTKMNDGLAKRKESKCAILERGGRWRQPGRAWLWCGADSLAGVNKGRFSRQQTTLTSVVDTTVEDEVDNDTDRRLSIIGWSQTTNQRSNSLVLQSVAEDSSLDGTSPSNKSARSMSKVNAFTLQGGNDASTLVTDLTQGWLHEDDAGEMSLFDRIKGVGRTRQEAEDDQFLQEFKGRITVCLGPPPLPLTQQAAPKQQKKAGGGAIAALMAYQQSGEKPSMEAVEALIPSISSKYPVGVVLWRFFDTLDARGCGSVTVAQFRRRLYKMSRDAEIATAFERAQSADTGLNETPVYPALFNAFEDEECLEREKAAAKEEAKQNKPSTFTPGSASGSGSADGVIEGGPRWLLREVAAELCREAEAQRAHRQTHLKSQRKVSTTPTQAKEKLKSNAKSENVSPLRYRQVQVAVRFASDGSADEKSADEKSGKTRKTSLVKVGNATA
jgi:hypothetical protein